MDRRPGHRFNRGRVYAVDGAGAAAVQTPAVTLGANLIAWWNADAANVTVGAGDIISAANDLGTGNFDLTEATGLLGPVWVDAQINGRAVMRFDGAASRLSNATLNLPAPGTTPIYYWAVIKQVSYTTTDELWTGGTVSRGAIRQTGSSPELIMLCATAANTNNGAPIGTASRLIARFKGTTDDYLKCRAVVVTGTSAGVTDPAAGFFVGCRPALANFGNFELAELVISNLDLAHDSAQSVALDAYGVSRYGAGILS